MAKIVSECIEEELGPSYDASCFIVIWSTWDNVMWFLDKYKVKEFFMHWQMLNIMWIHLNLIMNRVDCCVYIQYSFNF